MLKVLFLSAWYPHRNDPMYGLFVRKHAEAVSRFAEEVAALYVVMDDNIDKTEIVANKNGNFYEAIVYYPGKKTEKNKVKRACKYLNAYLRGFTFLHRQWGKPNIVQANVFTRTAVIALIYKLVYKVPYVVIEHWTRYFRPDTFSNKLHQLITKVVARKAGAIMPVTSHLENCMKSHGLENDNYIVINNVVDDFFGAGNKTNVSDKKMILHVSCFDDDQKNLTGILNTIHKLSGVRNDFCFYLIGTGRDFDLIHEKALTLGLNEDKLVFTGMLQGKELANFYRHCSFVVLFSNYENIPVVVSESLVCGKPVISTNVGGISEHINNSNGLLISRGDEAALYKAINYMLDNSENYNSGEISEKAGEMYSYDAVGRKLTDIYNHILYKSC
jgi:glycosyltransferase involved in cell wall biosynthesis